MTMPFYVSPEQLMKDRADYARKGIGRGRSVAVLQYSDGILFVSENPSQALHKISEIYDRIGFAAVGRYNEFENLRIAGVRLADLRGYSYDRRDVTGRGLANAYAQTLGSIFSSGGEKPYEVELFVAELGESSPSDQVFRLTYDGQVADEQGFAAMGGQAESVTSYLSERWRDGLTLTEALRLAVAALGHGDSGEDRTIPPADLEVAVLDRTRTQQRKFRRIGDALLAGMLDGPPPEPPGAGPDGAPDDPDDQSGGDDHDAPDTPPAAVALAPALVEEPGTEAEAQAEPELQEAGSTEETIDEAPEPELVPETDSQPESPTFDAEAADPVEVASAESPLTELDIEQDQQAEQPEQVGHEGTTDHTASPEESSPDPEWPPVAPPLPPLTPEPSEDTPETPAETPTETPSWIAEEPEPAVSEPADQPTQVFAAIDEEPAPPRADRPPPPESPWSNEPQDAPEATEDLEREWGSDTRDAGSGGGGSFFDLYGDPAGQETSSDAESEPDTKDGDGDDSEDRTDDEDRRY